MVKKTSTRNRLMGVKREGKKRREIKERKGRCKIREKRGID